jgi:hypothetical protein
MCVGRFGASSPVENRFAALSSMSRRVRRRGAANFFAFAMNERSFASLAHSVAAEWEFGGGEK